jgi:thiol-disulfide isomerase/thioredoxin
MLPVLGATLPRGICGYDFAQAQSRAAPTLGRFMPTEPGVPVPELPFTDGSGESITINAFRGRVVLINFWATWCAPCIEEMPALDRLQAKFKPEEFEIVAIALDRQGERVVRPFFDKLRLERMKLYLDASNISSRLMSVSAMPTSILVAKDGAELGRVLGPAKWDGREFERLVRRAIDAPRATTRS